MFKHYGLTLTIAIFTALLCAGCSTPQTTQTTQGAGSNAAQVQTQTSSTAVNENVARSGSPLDSLRPHHVCLSVPNLEETIRWYDEMLGFKIVRRWEFPEFRTRFAYLELNGFRIEVTAREGSNRVLDPRRDPAQDLATQGVKHIGMTVSDLDATIAELKRRGVEIVWEPRDDERSGVKLAFVKDNNGNGIELIEAR